MYTYHPRTLVVFWYTDTHGRKWEHLTTWDNFKHTAVNLLEKYVDECHNISYTINDNTYELDYYNTAL